LIKLFFLKEKFGKKSLVARCIQGCGDSIMKYGGQIRKYLGDTILFTFTDLRQAVCAAKEIASNYRREVNSLTLRYNVAIATGEVFVGKIGHPSYLVEDVMGEVVNRAAMLVTKLFLPLISFDHTFLS
jgi:class 3 adenylate cyclase